MTLEETYRAGRRELMEAGIESPAFDAVCIFEKYFGLDRQGLILRGREEAGEEASHAFFGSIRERAAGRPLQYILGVWPFLDMELAVGEGVLAPREETELLVREGAARLRRELPGAGDGEGLLIADLCSGSGAVALGLAGEFPAASVRAVERFPAAYSYLTENIRRTGKRRRFFRPFAAGGESSLCNLRGDRRPPAGAPPRAAFRPRRRRGRPCLLPRDRRALDSLSCTGRRLRR